MRFSQEVAPTSPRDGTYTLFVPVQLPDSLSIDGDAEDEWAGLRMRVRSRSANDVDIVVRGFPTEDDARIGFEAVKAWLVWTSLAFNHGLRFADHEERVTWFDEPPPDGELLGGVKGFANRGPVIYPTGERIALASVGPARPVVSYPAQRILDHLKEAADAGVTMAPDYDATRAGVELYLATSWEASNYARFLTLVNVLEALKQQPLLGQGVQDLVNEWQRGVDEALAECRIDRDSAESLRGSLNRLRRRGIRASVRALVMEKLDDQEKAAEAARIYDERSVLVHDGTLPEDLSDRVTTLQRLVPHLLRAILTGPSST